MYPQTKNASNEHLDVAEKMAIEICNMPTHIQNDMVKHIIDFVGARRVELLNQLRNNLEVEEKVFSSYEELLKSPNEVKQKIS